MVGPEFPNSKPGGNDGNRKGIQGGNRMFCRYLDFFGALPVAGEQAVAPDLLRAYPSIAITFQIFAPHEACPFQSSGFDQTPATSSVDDFQIAFDFIALLKPMHN